MSVKNNQFVAAAALAVGVNVAVGLPPIAEGLLNDMPVKSMAASEITDGTGRALVFVTVEDKTGAEPVDVVRAVADAQGNVRLFSDAAAVVTLAKRSNLIAGAAVQIVRFNKAASVGDPISGLKTKFKKMRTEAQTATGRQTELQNKKQAAIALGWDDAIGSPEHTEYQDLLARLATVVEWAAFVVAIRDDLAQALTDAGIDPLTVT